MRKRLKGSATVEAAVIVPLIIMMIAAITLILFYYHDKNIITGAAYEIAVVGSADSEFTKEELGEQLQDRLDKKLLLFTKIYASVQMEKSKIIIQCNTAKKGMSISVQVSMIRTEPENYIRSIRSIEKLGNQIGESYEGIL